MTAADVLAALRERGVELSVTAGRVLYRAPAGALDDDLRRAAAEHRGELLALLTWDAETAVHELDKALAVIDGALSLPWLSPAQRGVLAGMKAVVERYHARRDVLLFGAAAWIAGHVGRWGAEHDAQIRSRGETAFGPS